MSTELRPTTTGLLLSGGIDSAVLLNELLALGGDVVPFYIRTGCAWDECELTAVRRFLAALQHGGLAELVVFELPLADLYDDHWSITGESVPDDRTPDEAVFMPGHNPLLLIKPALWCQLHGVPRLALATLANNPFDDATPKFFAAFETMIGLATGAQMEIICPFERLQKHTVLELGRHLPLELTFSCLAPIEGLHCGRCNKCAERRLAFQQVALTDRTRYHEALARPCGRPG